MTRRGVNEVIPGKLYQRGHFLTWTHEQKHQMLLELGITVVVNLWNHVDPDLSRDIEGVLYLNYVASPSRVPPEADLLVAFLTGLLKSGHRLLVHCEAGRGRSVWLCGRLVRSYISATSGADALAWVLDAVPKADVNLILQKDITGGEG